MASGAHMWAKFVLTNLFAFFLGTGGAHLAENEDWKNVGGLMMVVALISFLLSFSNLDNDRHRAYEYSLNKPRDSYGGGRFLWILILLAGVLLFEPVRAHPPSFLKRWIGVGTEQRENESSGANAVPLGLRGQNILHSKRLGVQFGPRNVQLSEGNRPQVVPWTQEILRTTWYVRPLREDQLRTSAEKQVLEDALVVIQSNAHVPASEERKLQARAGHLLGVTTYFFESEADYEAFEDAVFERRVTRLMALSDRGNALTSVDDWKPSDFKRVLRPERWTPR